jgi:hypothetical protein
MERSTDYLKKMKPDPLRSIFPSFLLRSLTWVALGLDQASELPPSPIRCRE